MRKTIAVKQCHIKKGVRESMKSCPIALAMKDEGFIFNNGSYTGVDCSVVRYPGKAGNIKSSLLPDEAVTFIGAFDRDEPVKPFQFTLEVEE